MEYQMFRCRLENPSHHRLKWLGLLSLATASLLAACGGGGGSDDDGVGITNTAPTATSFTCSSAVGNTQKSCNWRTLSAATDVNGDAMTATFYYLGTSYTTFGTANGTYTISGDTITYTPSLPTSATSDVAPLRITDSKGAYRDITVTSSGIDGAGPTLTQTGTTTGSGSYTTSMVGNEGLASRSVVTTYHAGSGIYGSLPGSATTTLTPVGLVSGSSHPGTVTYSLTGGSAGFYQAFFTVTDSLNNTSTHTLYFSLP